MDEDLGRIDLEENRGWSTFKSKNAAFCFACKNFCPTFRNPAFGSTGFKNWKKATEVNKGFEQHEHSQAHITSMNR